MRQYVKQSRQIGRMIKAVRVKQNITQEKMAIKLQLSGCDMTRGTYAKIEAGVRQMTTSELRAICKVLGLDDNALLQYEKIEGETT